MAPLAYGPQHSSSSNPALFSGVSWGDELGGMFRSLGEAGTEVPTSELVLMLPGPLPSYEPHPSGCYPTPIFSKSENGTAGRGG